MRHNRSTRRSTHSTPSPTPPPIPPTISIGIDRTTNNFLVSTSRGIHVFTPSTVQLPQRLVPLWARYHPRNWRLPLFPGRSPTMADNQSHNHIPTPQTTTTPPTPSTTAQAQPANPTTLPQGQPATAQNVQPPSTPSPSSNIPPFSEFSSVPSRHNDQQMILDSLQHVTANTS